MLTGQFPFEEEHVPALIEKILKGNVYFPNYLSPGINFSSHLFFD